MRPWSFRARSRDTRTSEASAGSSWGPWTRAYRARVQLSSRRETRPVRNITPMRTAGILGFLGVALGAFGAHGLKGWLAPMADGAERLAWWNTGVQYHLWHALLLVGMALLPSTKVTRVGGALCVAGIALFSGSLYVMTLTGIKILGAVTPFGGLAFLGAWVCVVVAGKRAATAAVVCVLVTSS